MRAMSEMECPNCNSKVAQEDNFCGECGIKLKDICKCWVKKDSYNCGEDSCPGYGLFKIEKAKAQETFSPVHIRNR